MLYRPTLVTSMWDTWLYHHEGIHYLFYLHQTFGARWDGMSVATSADGVHFNEIGPILHKREDAEWLGTGSVWRVGDRFVLNFSESRDGVQAIFFAASRDLIHWRRLPDELRSDPDPRWYDDTRTGRWDCIWGMRRPDGSMVGYLTARPWSRTSGLACESVGKVESVDGLHWQAAEPPVIDWGEWPRMDVGEVGAIQQIAGRYYLLLGYSEAGLGNRHACEEQGSRMGMYTFVSDSPDGPFRADTRAHRLLTSNTATKLMTYFARFYTLPDAVLVNHHSITRSDVVWFAPLKRAVVDAEGHLRLGYWEGNEAIKGRAIPLNLATCERVLPPEPNPAWKATPERLEISQPFGGGLVLFPNHFNLGQGVVLEGEWTLYEPPGRWSGVGFYVEESARGNTGTAFMLETRGRAEIGRLNGQGRFVPDDVLPLEIRPGIKHHFRLLVRQSLAELYVNDLLVQCYSLPEWASGHLGLVVESGRAVFENVRAWEMTL
ncbi:MAG: hypothetical protein GX552_00580 [Chloroflexi bacterium]|jgi:hypothetical protein|nr:hypothetical protein [Chloroflexota bacterium]